MVKNMHYINGRYGDNDDDDAISSLEKETISDSCLHLTSCFVQIPQVLSMC